MKTQEIVNDQGYQSKRFRFIEGEASVQGSKAWHDFRRGKIGASDVASILGVSPFESKLQAYERIVFGKSKATTGAMRRGSELEGKAREIINQLTGRNYKPAVIQSINHPDLIASLDGMWVSPEGKLFICEIKCPNATTHAEARMGFIPSHYLPQLCQQQDLSGADSTIYVSWDGQSDKVEIVEYRPNTDMAQKQFKEVMTFLSSMNKFKPPEPAERDWVRCDEDELIVKADRYRHLSLLIDDLEFERESIKKYLTEEMDNPRSIVGDLRIQKIIRKGSVDYTQIPELSSVDLEKYRKNSVESWRISYE